MLFDIPGVFVNDGTLFRPVDRTWIKANDVWQEVKATYVKANGVWAAVAGSFAPTFSGVAGNFGVASRPIPPDVLPVSDGGSGDGGSDNTTGPGTTFGGGFTVDYSPDFSAPTMSA
jgi:hypothetical protein